MLRENIQLGGPWSALDYNTEHLAALLILLRIFFRKLNNPLNLPWLFHLVALPVPFPAGSKVKPVGLESFCREEPKQGRWIEPRTEMI